jgi:molecular chaperone GrpE
MESEREQDVPADAQDGLAAGDTSGDKTSAAAGAISTREAELQAAIDKLTAEKNDLTDLLLRKQAELENFRKRMQREKEEFLQHAAADLIHNLLPTLDALDRALSHRNEGVPEEFFQGLELIRKELMDVLSRAGLTPLESVGHLFDPHVHQAVEMVEAGKHRDQEIVEEMQRGYKLKKRLLRPAVVKVAVARTNSSKAGSGEPA